LAIVHVQSSRALARAATAKPADRSDAFAEERRLIAVAIEPPDAAL
jgi:hypothetical protein